MLTYAVKQDLIISAYKPEADFEARFLEAGGDIGGAWDFARQHLEQLAPSVLNDNCILEFIEERAPYLLYDRLVAFHIQRGLPVPLSAPEFYAGLPERFLERDGMIFTSVQAPSMTGCGCWPSGWNNCRFLSLMKRARCNGCGARWIRC